MARSARAWSTAAAAAVLGVSSIVAYVHYQSAKATRRRRKGLPSGSSSTHPAFMVSVVKGEEPGRSLSVVLLASHFQNSRYWLRIAAILASQGYDCHCVDFLPGSTETLLASLRSYVQQLSPQPAFQGSEERKRVVLLGHSLGGTLAQLYAKSGAPVSGLVLAAAAGVEANDVRLMREKFFGQAEGSAYTYYFDLLARSVARPWWLRSKVLPLLFGPSTFSTMLASELNNGPASPGLLSFADDVDLLLDEQLPFKCFEESLCESSDLDSPPPSSPLAPLPTLLLQVRATCREPCTRPRYS